MISAVQCHYHDNNLRVQNVLGLKTVLDLSVLTVICGVVDFLAAHVLVDDVSFFSGFLCIDYDFLQTF